MQRLPGTVAGLPKKEKIKRWEGSEQERGIEAARGCRDDRKPLSGKGVPAFQFGDPQPKKTGGKGCGRNRPCRPNREGFRGLFPARKREEGV